MADSWRCARCDINYPDPGECVGCLDQLWEDKKVPHDDDWKQKALRAAAHREFNSSPLIPDINIEVLSYKKRLWVAEKHLLDGGYEPDDFTIVKINKQFYELMGRKAGEVPAWWIELVEPQFAFEDLPELSQWEYGELEKRRGLRT
jgi:hypothetical protein